MVIKPLNFPRLWSSIIWTYLVLLFYLCLTPTAPEGFSKLSLPHADKIIHFLAYLCLGFLFHQILARTPRILLFKATVIGVVIEILQTQVPTRSFELADILANTLGAFTGIVLSGRYFSELVFKLDQFLHGRRSD